jgi:tRNA A37 methylthiotransferase MiaB
MLGKTDNNRIIEFKESKDLLNKFVNVKVMKILGKSLVGELV